MTRAKTLLLLCLLVAPLSRAFAQVTVPEKTETGKFVTVDYAGEVPDPEHGQNAYQLLLDSTSSSWPVAEGKFIVTAKLGTHTGLLSVAKQTWETIQVEVTDPETGEKVLREIHNPIDLKIDVYRFTYTVVNGPDDPDVPDVPDDPDVPDPNDPDEPDVPDVPDDPAPNDPWGVIPAIKDIASKVPLDARRQATATAKLFDQAADGLIPEDGADPSFLDRDEAITWLKAERKKLWGNKESDWSAFVEAINYVYQDPNTQPTNKQETAGFWRATAYGLRQIQAY